MGWLEGLLTGYVDRSHEIEKQKMEEAVRTREQQAKIYEALLSSPDPKTRHYAATGMLDMANPLRKSKGLTGWMGEIEQSPNFEMLRRHLDTEQPYEETYLKPGPPKKVEGQETIHRVGFEDVTPQQLPGFQAAPPPPPPAAAAALPSSSPTELGTPALTPPPAPPPAATELPPILRGSRPPPPPGTPAQPQQIDPEALAAAPPVNVGPGGAMDAGQAFKGASPPPATLSPPWAPESFPVTREVPGDPVQATRTVYRRPQAFPTTADTAAAASEGRERGEWQQAVNMFAQAGSPNPEKDAMEFITAQKGAGSYAAGPVIPDPASPTGYSQQWVDKRNPAIRSSVPAPAPGTGGNRVASTVELVAHGLYGQPGEDAKTTFARIQREGGGKAENAMKRAQYFIASKPLTIQERFQDQGRLQDDWMKISTAHRILVPQMQIMRNAWARAHEDPKNIPAAAEQILITFQRILDPASVVRETEARRPGSMQAMLTRIQGWVDANVLGGPGIPLEAMEPYLEAAEDTLRMSEAIMAQERQRILATAEEFQIGPLNLVGFQPAPPRPGGPPQPPPQTTNPVTNSGGGAGGAGGGGGVNLQTPLDQIDPATGQRRR